MSDASIIAAAKDLADQFKEIANDLDKIHSVASGVKLLGKIGAVAGLGIGVAASVVTGGLAAPLVAAGGIAAVAGTATSVGADVIEKLVSKEKLKKAQSKLETFRSRMRSARIVVRGATTALEASSALKEFIELSSSGKTLLKALPVLSKIFLFYEVFDILVLLVNKNKSEPAQEVRKLEKALRDLRA